MPLTFSGPNLADQTGASDTISIQPVPPQTSTQVTFAAATYGSEKDGSPHNLPDVAGKTSLTFTVLSGLNRLVFGLISPAPQLQSVNIVQGETILVTVSVEFNSGVGTLPIMGTGAAEGGND
jgi:hypothetical protein